MVMKYGKLTGHGLLGASKSNEALEVSLVRATPGALMTVASFKPKFTYPIFGDDEAIFGYQDLKINLRFHVTDMRPNLRVGWGKKFRAIGDTEPTDVTGFMKEFLPDGTYSSAELRCSQG